MGRPSKLNPELRDQLCQHLEAGHLIGTAADLCGVGRSTVHRWMARAEEDDAPEEYREFREALTRARARATTVLVSAAFADAVGGAVVREVVRPDGTQERTLTAPNGRVALDLLGRMFPEDWRPVKAVEVSGPQGGPVELGPDRKVIEHIRERVRLAKARREKESRSTDEGR